MYIWLATTCFFSWAQSCSNFKVKKSNIHTLANDGKMTYYLKPEPGTTWLFKIFLSMFLRFLSFYFLVYIYLVDYSMFFLGYNPIRFLK